MTFLSLFFVLEETDSDGDDDNKIENKINNNLTIPSMQKGYCFSFNVHNTSCSIFKEDIHQIGLNLSKGIRIFLPSSISFLPSQNGVISLLYYYKTKQIPIT